jgi:hypothetical protein
MGFAPTGGDRWKRIAEWKAESWVERQRARSPSERLQAAEALRTHVRTLRPDWPDAASRAADLAAHTRLSELMRRADRQ